MKPQPKIATCCYCGTRAVLKLTGTTSHELACASCGAPLRFLKPIPVETRKDVKPSRRKSAPKRHKKKPKRKGFLAWVAEEIWDEVEDFFD